MNNTDKRRKTPKEFFKSLEESTDFVYHLTASNTFKKDIDLCYKRNLELELLETVVLKLARGEKLDEKYRVHKFHRIATQYNEDHYCPIKTQFYFFTIVIQVHMQKK